MLKLNKNIEVVSLIDKVKEYIVKTTENFDYFTNEEELDNGMISIDCRDKNGKEYEFYYYSRRNFLKIICIGCWSKQITNLHF